MDATPDVRDAEAAALKALYEARTAGVSQAAFGALHDIGSSGMVWQYLSGHRPLNLEAATKFARALGVTIDSFSPRLAQHVRESAGLVAREPHVTYHVADAMGTLISKLEPEQRATQLDLLRAQLRRSGKRLVGDREFDEAMAAIEALDLDASPPEPKRQ